MLKQREEFWQASGKPETFRFHHVSTDEVFGSLTSDPTLQFTEMLLYNPVVHIPSKASSDHLVRAWHHTYGLPVLLTMFKQLWSISLP